jgi:hypothetical protein
VGTLSAGAKLKVAPVRLAPVTVKLCWIGEELLTRKVGLRETIAGTGMTVKFVLEVAVTPLTVTPINPVVAVVGTVTVNVEAVAETTVAATPLMVTAFEAAVALKFCP